MERYLESKGKLKAFHAAYEKQTALHWLQERDAYQFNRDEVVKAFSAKRSAKARPQPKVIDGGRRQLSMSVENFCKWVKSTWNSKGREQPDRVPCR